MSIRRYALAALASAVFAGSAIAKDYELLNVSYDPTASCTSSTTPSSSSTGSRPTRATR